MNKFSGFVYIHNIDVISSRSSKSDKFSYLFAFVDRGAVNHFPCEIFCVFLDSYNHVVHLLIDIIFMVKMLKIKLIGRKIIL